MSYSYHDESHNRFASTAYVGRPPAINKLLVELSTRVPVEIVTIRERTLGPVSRLSLSMRARLLTGSRKQSD